MMIVRKEKNGFIAISIIYSFFLVFVLLILLIISTLIANRNNDNIYILDIKNRLATQNTPEPTPITPEPMNTESPSCTLKVSGDVITWNEKSDDVRVTKYGLGNTPDLANGKDTLTLAEGTFYGTVYDEAGNKGSCSIKVVTGSVLEYTSEIRCCPNDDQHTDAAGNPYCSTSAYTIDYHTGPKCVEVNQYFCSRYSCKATSASCEEGFTNASGTKYCYKLGS